MAATFTPEEVAKHCWEGDLWMVIDGDVYDLSKFGSLHPGGLPPLLDPTVAGKDATELLYPPLGVFFHFFHIKPKRIFMNNTNFL